MSDKKLSFIFPGQGSQHQGMLADYAKSYPLLRQVVEEGSEALGLDLWGMMQTGNADTLSLTENAQPLILAASIAIWRLWRHENGKVPDILAGHSLGEWAALVAAKVISYADALRLVKLRGQYMQEAVPIGVGAMAAIIGMSDEEVEIICSGCSKDDSLVLAVNYNAPGQVVIAGHATAVEAAVTACKGSGAKRALTLAVSAPFHTPLMQPAAEQLADHLTATSFSSPCIPVIHNASLKAENDPEKIKNLLIKQIYSPVPWVATINTLQTQGVTGFCECGPGKVLSGLGRRINKSIPFFALESESGLASAKKELF